MDNLLSQLRGMGLRLALRDEFTVRAGPKSMLNDNTRALIWSRKDELLALLKAELPPEEAKKEPLAPGERFRKALFGE